MYGSVFEKDNSRNVKQSGGFLFDEPVKWHHGIKVLLCDYSIHFIGKWMVLQCDNNAIEWSRSLVSKSIEILTLCQNLHGMFSARYYTVWAAAKEEVTGGILYTVDP